MSGTGVQHDQVLAGRVFLNRYASPLRTGRLLPFIGELSRHGSSHAGMEFLPDSCIIETSEPSDAVWVVIDGTARLSYPAVDWNPRVSRLTVPGEIVGLTEAIAGLPYALTLVAVTTCSCLNLPRLEFMGRLRKDRLFRTAVLSMLAESLCYGYGTQLNLVTTITDAKIDKRIS